MQLKEVTTSEIEKLTGREDVQIIDVRPTEAYNGWALRGEHRGGHIPGARTLPVKWADYIDWIEIVRHKEIHPHHQVVLYGYTREDVEKVAERFTGAGYNNVSWYAGFVSEWLANDDLPLDILVRYRHLVYPAWVNTLIGGGRPPHYNNGKDFVVVHAHYRNHDDYLKGHIPGAIAMDTLALEAPETWNRRSPRELKKALEKHGITADTTVVLYGRFSFPNNDDPFPGSAAGQLAAMRCALIMMYAGVKDVRVLNGGLAAWEAEDLPLEKHSVDPVPVEEFGADIPGQHDLIVDIEEARALIESTDGDIVCTRSWPEYIGEVSGYNYIEQKGRIPGAVYVNNGSDAYHMENYQNLDYTTREYNEIAAMLKEAGLHSGQRLAFYCGTGWRGSEAFYNAWLMGWPRVAVFDGGWFEWSNDPQNPVETGIPEKEPWFNKK
ncbi:MAG: rhodanese-like domain-containing protein [Bacteroidota bacterium]